MRRRVSQLWKRIWTTNRQPNADVELMNEYMTTETKTTPQRLSSEDIHLLCQQLAANDANLVTLDLSKQDLDYEDANALGNALRINDTLCMLNLGENLLGDEGAFVLLEALQHHVALEYLLLNKNNISNLSALAPILPPALKWLDLSGNNIYVAEHLLEAAALHPTLDTLDLSVNHIGKNDARAVSCALQSLVEINLFANRLDDATCLVLADSGYGSVQKLNLGYNHIGNEGAKGLLLAMEKPNALKSLVLTGNAITNMEIKVALRAGAATL